MYAIITILIIGKYYIWNSYKTKEGDFTKAFWRASTILIKRPIVTVFFSLFMLLITIYNYYSPITGLSSILFDSSTFEGGNIFETIVSLLRLTLSHILTTNGVLLTGGVVFILAIIFGIILSGYMYVINSALEGNKKENKEFIKGIKKHFLKMTGMTFISLISGLVLAIFMLIAAVPAMVLTTALITGNAQYFLGALLVDFVTAGVLIFSVMFFSIYVSFWYVATICGKKHAFLQGKHLADENFWRYAKRLILLYFIFIIFEAIFSYMGNAPFIYILKWLFSSLFFGFLIPYIIALFKQFEGKPTS